MIVKYNEKLPQTLLVASRRSPLAIAQVNEILNELRQHHPHISFKSLFIDTQGDKDQLTSLRTLEKTDFFTKEIDIVLLSGQCRIAIHSAKDLPEPLPVGLSMVALTRGVDPADVLVLREGERISSLAQGAVIATSSLRREAAVKQLRSDFTFIDLRGTIQQRLAHLDLGLADGVVVAEAALIRLNLTHLNRVRLPGESVSWQGRLAVVAQESDEEMHNLFSCIDNKD